MKKLLITAALALCLLALTGCVDASLAPDPEATPMPPLTAPLITDRAALYEYYNQVSLNNTIAQLTERYGEPTLEELSEGTQYTWLMDGAHGFAAAAYENGKLRAKVVYYEDLRQLLPLASGTNMDAASSITNNYTYDMVVSTFGAQGLEIAQITTNASLNPGIARLYLWSDGEIAVTVYINENGLAEQVNYNYLT